MNGHRVVEDEVDVFEVLGILWRRRWIILGLVIATVVVVNVFLFFVPPSYKATAKIIPIYSGGRLYLPFIPSELFGVIGGGEADRKNVIKAILDSREIAKMVIKKYDLRRYILPDVWDERTGDLKIPESEVPQDDEIAEIFLEDFLQVREKPMLGVIEISVIFPKHATLAAIVANGILDALQAILNQNAYTIAKRNRMFIEEQAKIAKANLERSEEEFRRFQEKYSVIAIDRQMEESIRLYAELMAMLSEREIRLGAIRRMTSPDNPEAVAIEYEIGELRRKLRELEEGQKKTRAKGYVLDTSRRVIMPFESVPDIALEYIRRKRELEVQSEIYKMIITMLEKAKIEESKEDISFQVIDYAYVPRYPFKPRRIFVTAVSAALAMFFGMVVCLFVDLWFARRKNQP